jgi:hypothetical protein
MNFGILHCSYSRVAALIILAALSSSCERQNTAKQKKVPNPQAKAYLDDIAAKEASNIRKGWVHIEGAGYHYDVPAGWTESKDMEKGVYFRLTPPEKNLTIRLTSRYIESIPEGVRDLNDWVELQYSSMGMPEAVEETRKIEVADGDALEAWIKIGDNRLRVRYFLDIFQNPGNQRLWLLLVEAKSKSRLESPEVQKVLDTFRVQDFRWHPDQPATAPEPKPDDNEKSAPESK